MKKITKKAKFNQKQLNEAIEQEKKHQKWLKVAELSKSFAHSRFFHFQKEHVWPILLPFVVVMIFLIILPLISILLYAILQPTGNSLMFEVSLKNFLKLFTNANIMIALLLSVAYAVCASLLAILVGYPIALMMSQMRSKILAKNMWVLVTMPIWISMLLKVLGLQSFFYLLSPTIIGTPIALIVGMVYMFLPFAIIPIYDSLESRSLDFEEAARDLGMSGFKTFWHITFRASIPGVLTAFSLVIVQAATSLIVVHYMGDGRINLIASIIETYFFKGNDFGFGAAVSTVLTVLIFLLIVVIRAVSKRFEHSEKGRRKWRNSSREVILPS